MLVLTRKVGQAILIHPGITVTVAEIRGSTVRLGIDAPSSSAIARKELITDEEDESDG